MRSIPFGQPPVNSNENYLRALKQARPGSDLQQHSRSLSNPGYPTHQPSLQSQR